MNKRPFNKSINYLRALQAQPIQPVRPKVSKPAYKTKKKKLKKSYEEDPLDDFLLKDDDIEDILG